MKNVIFSALFTLTVATSAFATGENKISSVVLSNFRSDFKNAKNVVWISRADFSKADFTMENQKMEAFYNLNGEMFAISKTIQLDELPTRAKRAFARRYEGYTVKEAIKFDGLNETSYYISAENNNETVILKVDENEQLSAFKKTKK